MNPILPRSFFMADAEAHVMPDGRLYVVGSTDISGSGDYCSPGYHIWSTDDPELKNWKDHGRVFSNYKEDPGIPWAPGTPLYAPDMIYKNGKYCLYICGANQFEAVAFASKPEGPYGDVKKIEGADGDGIDPAVFVDDDGAAYYFWGQFHLRGARLRDNMYQLEPKTVTDNILTEQEHGFHEGSSIRKIGGRYYLVYTDISRGRATCMSYAVADRPLGPYKKGGVIIDNTYCDPETWNDHGSIEFWKGRLFVFYHRSTQKSFTSRRVCAEPLTMLPDGSIMEAEMTSSGAEPPINAFEEIDASIASRMKGSLYIAPDPDRKGEEILTECGGGNWTLAWAEYKYIDFGNGVNHFRITGSGKGAVTLMTEGGNKIGRAELNSEDGRWMRAEAGLTENIQGVRRIWLLFDGEGMKISSFRFGNI